MSNSPEDLSGIDGSRNLVIKKEDPSGDLDPNEVQQLIDSAGVVDRENDNLRDNPDVIRLTNRNRDMLIIKTPQPGRITTTTFSVYSEPGLPRRAAIYSTVSPAGQDPTVSPPTYYSLRVGRSVLQRLTKSAPEPAQ